MNEKITIVIPIYNVEEYIEKCLQTVLNQTYKNLEIILINDGSTDGSENKCKKIMEKDNRTILISTSNRGVSSARNIGIEKATGDYIIFIDADDWIELNMIEELYKNIKKHDADIAICDFYINNLKKEYAHTKMQREEIITNKQIMYEYLFNNDFYEGYIWNKLIKREKILNIRFDKKIKLQEDAVFLSELFENIDKIIYMPNKKLYHYRIRKNSAVKFKYIPRDFTKLYAFEKFIKIKYKYSVNSLEKIEYLYYTMARQGIYIFKKAQINDEKNNKKIKNISEKYFKIAFKEANFIQKIRVLMLRFTPILYGKWRDCSNNIKYSRGIKNGRVN